MLHEYMIIIIIIIIIKYINNLLIMIIILIVVKDIHINKDKDMLTNIFTIK